MFIYFESFLSLSLYLFLISALFQLTEMIFNS